MIDLHVHTTASDGSLTPAEVVTHACEKKLSAIAITDHDSISGIGEAVNAGKESGLCVVPGIEMSCVRDDVELHILGYYLDWESEDIANDLIWFQGARDRRNSIIIKNFHDAGIDISRKDLQFGNPDTVIGRGHFARYLVEHGIVSDKREAFEKYLYENGPFVPRKLITSEEVMDFMRKYNIYPALAHPMQYNMTPGKLDRTIGELVEMGLRAVEVWHPSTRIGSDNMLLKIVNKYGLMPTGGSDFHGSNKPGLDIGTGYGTLYVDDDVLAKMNVARNQEGLSQG